MINPPPPLHQLDKLTSQLAGIETGRSFLGDAAKAGCKLRLPQDVARLVGIPIGLEKLTGTGGISFEQRSSRLE